MKKEKKFTLCMTGGPWFDGEVNGVEYWDANYDILDEKGNVVGSTGRTGWPNAESLNALHGAKCDKRGNV